MIADCDIAVKLNNKYVKALDRRAKTVRKQAMQASAHILDPIFLTLNISVLPLLQVENYVIQVEKLKQCLEDITIVCILEGFQKQEHLMMVDSVLKELGRAEAGLASRNRSVFKSDLSHNFHCIQSMFKTGNQL